MTASREIEGRKFAVQPARGAVVCGSSFNLGIEPANGFFNIHSAYCGHPFTACVAKRHSYKFGGSAFRSAMLIVLRVCGFAQIMSAVIKPIMVNVVYGETVTGFRDSPVHHNGFVHAFDNLSAFSINAPHGAPLPLHQPLVIGGVHNRVQTLRKRDQAGILRHRRISSASVGARVLKHAAPKLYNIPFVWGEAA